MDRAVFTLFEVTRSIQKTVTDRYKKPYWIKAELNKLNYYKQSGHCFPELVEKKEGRVIAQIKSTIWKEDFIEINSRFLRVLKEPLKDGIKILFLAGVSFDPIYGLSLHIIDIDPAYTLGDLEKEKQETIKQLKEEGIFGQNKKLRLPLLPQRIAIISDETSKGYIDFLKIITGNARGYSFFHLLFPSLLQGERAVGSIISQLNRVRKVKSHFDMVAIIRGGGDDIGLSCYNNYLLAREIALFPIPVLTGIGHATNETVAEMISFSNAITPTKLAEYLLQIFNNYADPVQRAEERVVENSVRLVKDENLRFQSEVKLFHAAVYSLLRQNRNEIKIKVQSLSQQSMFRFRTEKNSLVRFAQEVQKGIQRKMERAGQNTGQLYARISAASVFIMKNGQKELMNLEKNIRNMSPEMVLKRGYSITLLEGKAVKNFKEVKAGDSLHTIVYEGNISSIVKSSDKKINNE